MLEAYPNDSSAPPSPTTRFDPFYHITRLFQPPSNGPVCCLRPLEPQEAPELLSFEEWKEKQRIVAEENVLPSAQDLISGLDTDRVEPHAGGDIVNHPKEQGSGRLNPSDLTLQAPHMFNQVPLIDRFNYGSEDCSARIHKSHKSAKSSHAILSSKKDRYMLSPCAEQDKFIIMELCDDIRIDSVQLANFEFFSGVFRDITISVAQTYTSDVDGWTEMGRYEAKNVRRVQTFHPLTDLRPFYRYIRIDFDSHYGNEYYCPVSLLRVYGVTQMEEWKWDVWASESQKRSTEAALHSAESASKATIADPWPVSSLTSGLETETQRMPLTTTATHTHVPSIASSSVDSFTNHGVDSATVTKTASISSSTIVSKDFRPSSPASDNSHDKPPLVDSKHPTSPNITTSAASAASVSPSAAVAGEMPCTGTSTITEENVSPETSELSPSDSAPPAAFHPSASTTPSTSSIVFNDTTQIAVADTPRYTPLLITASASSNAASSSGESVFRTIINRIAALEANSTLYIRFVEEQSRSVRDALRKLEEDVGRLEGISKSQTGMYLRAVEELAKQRTAFEMERMELAVRIQRLADEMTLEKRLGIAQLVLLFTLLVIMSLTRGSSGAVIVRKTARAMKRLGSRGRVLSLSGDWTNAFRSRSITPEEVRGSTTEDERHSADFGDAGEGSNVPVSYRPPAPEQPRQPRSSTSSSSAVISTPGLGYRTAPPRPITPTFSRFSPANTTRPRFLHRSNSQSYSIPRLPFEKSHGSEHIPHTPGLTPRLAKTAHIHEVRLKRKPNGLESPVKRLTNLSRPSSPSPLAHLRQKRQLSEISNPLERSIPRPSQLLGPESDAESWVDTDSSPEDDAGPGQEIEFPSIEEKMPSRIPLADPPRRRDMSIGSSKMGIPQGCLTLPETTV